MGITHAERIDNALRKALAARSELHPFFSENAPEPFFVKNLERVQGDERDAVILSVGYAKSPDGRLRYRFGPLLQAGGERRLNVAVTRARDRLTVVSTFSHLDMDPDRSHAPGVQLLRAFLEYAAHGADARAPGAAPTDLDPFQRYVRDWLVATGAPVRARHGTSGYRLDFALGHPDGRRQVLAIECDGPAYHSSRTARDRDRLRQDVLERLGWRFHRIWSTAFYRDPEGETARVAEAWKEAVAAADLSPAVAAPVPPAGGAVAGQVVAPAAPGTGGEGDGDEGPRGPRPVAGDGRPITSYRDTELVALVRWIEADTRLRTDDELLEDAVRELGYSRQGSRIAERLRRAISTVRAAGASEDEEAGADAGEVGAGADA
jgi:very-short-patch-repair endonuclease